MRIRKLTPRDVTFSLTIEPEDIPVEGEFDDPDVEREIIEAAQTYLEAWCVIVVKATWNGYSGVASLGGNSFLPPNNRESDFEETARAHGLYDKALDDLNNTLAQAAADLSKLEGHAENFARHRANGPHDDLDRVDPFIADKMRQIVKIIGYEKARRLLERIARER